MVRMFHDVSLSTANYDDTLVGWSNLPELQPHVHFDGGRSRYSSTTGYDAKETIITTYAWYIEDDGESFFY